ncbi:MAG: hypothetical protein ACRCVU_20245 [Flavobacterium sp.]
MTIEQMKERIELLEEALENIFMSRRRDSIYGNTLPDWCFDADNFEDFIQEMAEQ